MTERNAGKRHDSEGDAGDTLRVALLTTDSRFRGLVTERIEDTMPGAEMVCDVELPPGSLDDTSVGKLLSYRPDVLFVDVADRTSLGAEFIAAVTAQSPVAIVAAGAAVDAEQILSLIRAGASEYLPRPLEAEAVGNGCARVVRKLGYTAAPRSPRRGKVVSVFSPRGGAGVTTTAANLAVHIREATGRSVLLLDLSDGMGTAALQMGMEPRYSYVEAVKSLHRMDRQLLDSFLSEHESGVRLLSAPVAVEEGRALKPEQAGQLLRLVRSSFDYTVVDLGRGIDGVAVAAVKESDHRLLLATPDLPTLRNVKRVVDDVLPTSRDDVELIVNHHRGGESLSAKEISTAVGLPVGRLLPRDHEPVLESVNLGQPVVSEGTSAYADGIRALGDRIAAEHLPDDEPGPLESLWNRVFSPFSSSGRNGNGRKGASGGKNGDHRTNEPTAKRVERETAAADHDMEGASHR